MSYDFLRTKLSVDAVEEVERLLAQGKSYSSITALTGVSKASISRIKNGNYTKFEKTFDITKETEYINLAETNNKLTLQVKELKGELKSSRRKITMNEKIIEELRNQIEELQKVLGDTINKMPN